MKKIFSRKFISMLVLITFVSVFCFPAHPAQAKTDKAVKTEKQEKKGKVEAEAEAEINEYYSRDDANVIEDEGYPGGRKKKKFPWLLVVGGIVVVGVVLYFLVIKKPKYDLTVNVGEGVNGNPATGTYTYKKGETVSYNYSLQNGYADLDVKVDGASVPASGTINMDKDKSLTASATKVAALIVKSNPTGAQIILDGTDSGETTNHTFNFTTGGTHQVILRKLGYIQYSTSKSVALGDTETINATLTRGLREYFSTGATSSLLWEWVPHPSGNWSVSGGTYTAAASVSGWNYSIYNYNWASDKYTLIVRMNRSVGDTSQSNGVVLAESNSGTSVNGYLFVYTTSSWVSAWEYTGRNLQTGSGGTASVKYGWSYDTAVNKFLGQYNTIKIVRNGSTYTYYLNNKLITSFNDATYNPTYIVLLGYNGGSSTTLNFDYVYLDIGSTSGSVPAAPVKIIQSAEKQHPGYHRK